MNDDDRPPVVAHQRFAARRAAFAGLGLAARFERIAATNLWGARSVSGLGSERDATRAVGDALPDLLRRLGATSLLDAPCGDAAWISALDLGVTYTGVDIVPLLVAANVARGGQGRFVVADVTRDDLPAADVVLCRDCLVHLSFANIAAAVARFRASGAAWLVTTTFPLLQVNRDIEDGDWRALNFERAPFGWPPPVELVDERCTEAGGGWRDKSLGLWRLADLPV